MGRELLVIPRIIAPMVRITEKTFLENYTMQLNGQTLPAFSLITLPPPEKCDDADENITRLYGQSRKDYGRPKEEIDADLARRFGSDEPPPDETDEQGLEDDDDDIFDEQPPEQNE